MGEGGCRADGVQSRNSRIGGGSASWRTAGTSKLKIKAVPQPIKRICIGGVERGGQRDPAAWE